MKANIISIQFQERELCAVNRDDFHWGDDQQVAYTVLFDLEDGEEVVSIEFLQNVNDDTYLCHLIIMNERYNVKIASNGRGKTMPEAIATAFPRTKIIVTPTLAELNPNSDIDVYRVNSVMEAIAQELGVKRYKIFSAGSHPLK